MPSGYAVVKMQRYGAAQDVLSLNRLIDRYNWPVANDTV